MSKALVTAHGAGHRISRFGREAKQWEQQAAAENAASVMSEKAGEGAMLGLLGKCFAGVSAVT